MRSSEVAPFVELARSVPRSQRQPRFAGKVEAQLFEHRIVEGRPIPEVLHGRIKSRNLAKVLVHRHSDRFLFRAFTLNQIGLPINLNAARISFARNRS